MWWQIRYAAAVDYICPTLKVSLERVNYAFKLYLMRMYLCEIFKYDFRG